MSRTGVSLAGDEEDRLQPLPVDETIGRRVAAARRERGLSQARLAEMLQVRQQTVAAWESGRNVPPTEKLGALSQALGVSVDHLVLGDQGDVSNDRERVRRLRRALDIIEEALGDQLDDRD